MHIWALDVGQQEPQVFFSAVQEESFCLCLSILLSLYIIKIRVVKEQDKSVDKPKQLIFYERKTMLVDKPKQLIS